MDELWLNSSINSSLSPRSLFLTGIKSVEPGPFLHPSHFTASQPSAEKPKLTWDGSFREQALQGDALWLLGVGSTFHRKPPTIVFISFYEQAQNVIISTSLSFGRNSTCNILFQVVFIGKVIALCYLGTKKSHARETERQMV